MSDGRVAYASSLRLQQSQAGRLRHLLFRRPLSTETGQKEE